MFIVLLKRPNEIKPLTYCYLFLAEDDIATCLNIKHRIEHSEFLHEQKSIIF